MAETGLTVKVKAAQEPNVGRHFKEMANDASVLKRMIDDNKKGFDGLTQSIKLSHQAMKQFGDSVRFGSEQSKRFSQWAGAGTKGVAGGAGGSLGGSDFNPMAGLNAQALFETFNKIAESGKAVVSLFDSLSGGDNSRAALRKSGQLGGLSANLSDLVEDLFDRSGLVAHEGSQLDQWRKNSQERLASRREVQFIEADSFARPFQEARRRGEFGIAESQRRLEWEQDADRRGESGIWRDIHINRGMGLGFRDQVAARLAAAGDASRSGGSAAIRLGQQGTELKFAEEAQRKLIESEQKKLDLIRQQGKERQDQLKTQLQAAQQEEQRLKGIIEQEKSRLGGFAAEFGALDPLEQQRARELAQKARGGSLSRDELDEARQFGFFGDTVQRQFQQMGEQAGFGSIAKMLGLDLKQREAEIALEAVVKAQVDIKNEIKLSLEGNKNWVFEATEAVKAEFAKLKDIMAQQIAVGMQNELHRRKVAVDAGG